MRAARRSPFLLLPRFAPYLSYKLLAYGAPFLVLLALTPLAERPGRAVRARCSQAVNHPPAKPPPDTVER